MGIAELIRNAISINESGAIVFNALCIDGYDSLCRDRVVTHIHADHIVDLDRSIPRSRRIIATPITHELLEELGYIVPKTKKLALNYDEMHRLGDDVYVVLKKAQHIVGAAQVVYIEKDRVYAYTGDFKHPGKGTPIIKEPDVLVIDATYGNPEFRRPSEEVILDSFVSLIRNLIMKKPISIYAYYGKAQEAVILLREYGVDIPIIASPRQWRIMKRLERYGYVFTEVFLDGTREALEIKRDGWYIYVDHYTKFYSSRSRKHTYHVLLSGWIFSEPLRQLDENTWIVGLSDHADFDELVYYVEESRPRLLVVDGVRAGATAYVFAKHVIEKLGIQSVVMP